MARTGWVRTDSGHRKRSKDQIRPCLCHGIWLFVPQGVNALVSEGGKEHCFLFAFRVNEYMLKGKSAEATPETIPLRAPAPSSSNRPIPLDRAEGAGCHETSVTHRLLAPDTEP